MPLQISFRQQVSLDSSEKIKGDSGVKKYIGMLITVVLLAGCGSQQEQVNNPEQVETDDQASVVFRNIDVKVDDDQIHLIGEAKTSEDEIYYDLTQGEEVLEKETAITLDEGHLSWSGFEMEIPLPEGASDKTDPPIFMLYVKGHNEKAINPNYIPVDIVSN